MERQSPTSTSTAIRYSTGRRISSGFPLRSLTDKNNPEFTLNPDCLLITKNADRSTSTKSNTYAVQVVAYDSSGNDSEKSAAVSGWNASTDVSAFGGANDTTVNPLKPAPPAGLTITHVPG